MDPTSNTQTNFQPPQPSNIKKSKSLLLIFGALVLLLIIVGSEYYILDKQKQEARISSDKQISDLNEQISKLKSNSNVASTTSDTDLLNYLTIKKFNTTKDAELFYAAPVINKINSEWAITTPYLVMKNGSEIPGRGLNSYLWRKVSGTWTFIGIGGDAGYWDNDVKAVSSLIPEEIIPRCAFVEC